MKKINRVLVNKKLTIILLSIILFLGFAVRLYKINNPIADWHSWRQADTASVTREYLKNGLDLLHPTYHDISRVQTNYFNPEGYRFVEFPLYNLIHFILYSIKPSLGLIIWGRIISIFAALNTATMLYLISKNFMSKWGALSTSFFYLFLPFNIYFTRVILPDPLSVSLAITSVFLFYQYSKNTKWHSAIFSSIFFALALLVKPHAIFFSIPIVYLALAKFKISKLLKSHILLIALNIALLPFILWRVWIYQPELIRGMTLYDWAFNGDGIRFKPAFFKWIFGERVGKLILGTWGAGFIAFALNSVNKKNLITLTFALGALLYVTIFATANVRHDYYQIFIIPAVALLLGQGVGAILKSKISKLPIKIFTILTITTLMIGISLHDIKDNYQINNPNIIEAGNAIDELASENALVIAPYNGDTAFLYQTNRRGWPVITEDIQGLIDKGAEYYVSVDLGSNDTNILKSRFKTEVQNEKYIIINLTEKI